MRGNEAIVQQALRKLGADHSDMVRGREQTEHIFLPTGRFENAIEILGPPLSLETIDAESSGSGDSALLTKATYELPLWPGLVFYLLGMPGLPVARDFGFARSSVAPPITLDRPEDLQPWAFLRDEVIERFGPPVQEGDIWAPYEEYKFQACGADGRTRQFWTVFSWNLLQHIEWI
jgi:hypothetical protein